ncbi:dnaJ homolog subfamily C member 12-like [Mizuhopecten yessoensis]|uniref:DnaJ-like subfamily C member 12 n=1 Tax=Mizuhopecten yessoensis TaxID=6573 RepID=A0A210Q352_MIZYE|nr:dnaJ homolog subfamily C member 12-like [Mizuhopecten yessoensis]OWF43166.1 DnaJ-like subfamily C member 12 [Mizuhopecten yessoensis]
MEEILQHKCREEDDFYKILNCSEHSSTEQINTEYKILALECHPDKNPADHTAVEKFARLQKAKEVLSDQEMRKKYDKWKNSGIAMSYDQWSGLRDSVHTSMHWASVKPQPMLDHPEHRIKRPTQRSDTHGSVPVSTTSTSYQLATKEASSPPWERDAASTTLSKFRNYEI